MNCCPTPAKRIEHDVLGIAACSNNTLKQNLTGNEFDADLYKHFHWYISDGLHLAGYHQREALGERLKNYADCKTHSVHGKHANAFEIEFACRISISVNRSSVNSLPPLVEGVRDKMMLLRVNQPPADQTYLPHANLGQDEYETLIRAQLQCFGTGFETNTRHLLNLLMPARAKLGRL